MKTVHPKGDALPLAVTDPTPDVVGRGRHAAPIAAEIADSVRAESIPPATKRGRHRTPRNRAGFLAGFVMRFGRDPLALTDQPYQPNADTVSAHRTAHQAGVAPWS